MEPALGKKVIASYLAGDTVSPQDLRGALEAVASDPLWAEHLRHEVGYHGGWVTDCDTFLRRLDEFAEMSRQDKERNCPELLEHMASCADCADAYWQVAPLWVCDASSPAAARKLVARFHVPDEAGGDAAHQEPGPLPVRYRKLAIAVGGAALAAGLAMPQEWKLDDDELGISICVALRVDDSGNAELTCLLETADGAAVDSKAGRVLVVDPASGVTIDSASLGSPVMVRPGSWLVRVEWTSKDGARTWEIPVTIGGDHNG